MKWYNFKTHRPRNGSTCIVALDFDDEDCNYVYSIATYPAVCEEGEFFVLDREWGCYVEENPAYTFVKKWAYLEEPKNNK